MELIMAASPNKLLSVEEVAARVGVSRASIWDWTNPNSPRYKPHFPPRREGERGTVWWDIEVDDYIANRPLVRKNRGTSTVDENQNASETMHMPAPAPQPPGRAIDKNDVDSDRPPAIQVGEKNSPANGVVDRGERQNPEPDEEQIAKVQFLDIPSEAVINHLLVSDGESPELPMSSAPKSTEIIPPEVHHRSVSGTKLEAKDGPTAAKFRHLPEDSPSSQRNASEGSQVGQPTPSETRISTQESSTDPLFQPFDMNEELERKRSDKIFELLVDKAKKAKCMFYDDAMREVDLDPRAIEDRKAFSRIFEMVSRRSNSENGFMLGALLFEIRPGPGNSSPGKEFYDLAKSLGYELLPGKERELFRRHMERAFEFYENPKSPSGKVKSISLIGGGWHTWTRS